MTKKIIFLFIFWIILLFPLISSAQGLVPCGYDIDEDGLYEPVEEGCQLCHFFVMFDRIIDFVIGRLVPIVAVLMLVIAGAMFMMHQIGGAEVFPTGARGGPAMITQAKRLLTSVITGLIIIYAAWIIVNTFLVIIGVADWTGFFDNPATPKREAWFSIKDCPVP